MQISQKLPQFEDEKALLIVTGKQDASFYLAYKGKIDKLDEFYIPPITYSDKEGYSEKGRGGIVMGVGFVKEDRKETLRHKFLGKLDEHLKAISKKQPIDKIYLFCPSYVYLSIKGIIPYPLKEIPLTSFRGEFHHLHLFKLLEKIQEETSKTPVKMMRESAKKILDKAKQARKIIGK